jgi:hypothetical protein
MQGCLLGNILRKAIEAKRDYDCKVERFQLLISDVGAKHGSNGVVVYLEDSKRILAAMSSATDADFLKLYDDYVAGIIVQLDNLQYDAAYQRLLAMLSDLKTKYNL